MPEAAVEFCVDCPHPRYFHGRGGCTGQVATGTARGWAECHCDATFANRERFVSDLSRERITERQRTFAPQPSHDRDQAKG